MAKMISISDASSWQKLQHAYGNAGDTPRLLRDLAAFPASRSYKDDPYHSLWSSLCHQGDIYSASIAAVPHIVAAIEAAPDSFHWSAVSLVSCIEIARAKGNGPAADPVIYEAYHEALQRLPNALMVSSSRKWDELLVRSVASAIAAAKQQHVLAEAILELEPDLLPRFFSWLHDA